MNTVPAERLVWDIRCQAADLARQNPKLRPNDQEEIRQAIVLLMECLPKETREPQPARNAA